MSRWIVTLHARDNIRQFKEAGAGELLLSVPFFSLRPAHLFALKELPALVKDIHACGLRAAINCTRLFMEEELPRLREFLCLLKELDVDTIYFGDEGVLYEAAQLGMENRLVYQSDTLVANSRDVRFYLEQGVQGVALAREITLQEICAIANAQPGCEVLVHGRFSIMHSRRFLLTSYYAFLGREQQVRERRDLRLREMTRTAQMPVIEDESGTHVFSEYTLESFAQIQALAAAGVSRFRIDSIFHDDDWALCALRDYQAILRKERSKEQVMARRQQESQECYSEGFYYTKTTLVK